MSFGTCHGNNRSAVASQNFHRKAPASTVQELAYLYFSLCGFQITRCSFPGTIRSLSLLSDALFSSVKLYTTISTAKLASFADMTDPQIRSHILCLKHKSLHPSGTRQSSNVDFCLEKGLVHIADTRTAPTFAHYFIKQVNQLEQQVSLIS